MTSGFIVFVNGFIWFERGHAPLRTVLVGDGRGRFGLPGRLERAIWRAAQQKPRQAVGLAFDAEAPRDLFGRGLAPSFSIDPLRAVQILVAGGWAVVSQERCPGREHLLPQLEITAPAVVGETHSAVVLLDEIAGGQLA